ncbi:MAG: VPLPA-CTERM-specific exosortase XrtD [Proteobacteria bacterium]|nr:VPLPA-CTERM-specific exosortase XrtD [Pseudomonadota bacterium]
MKINLKAIGIVKPAGLAKIALYGLLVIGVYYSSLVVMISGWKKDDYSYCYLMPFVVLYLIWEKRSLLASLPSVSSWKGLIPFVLGIAFFWLGELGGEYLTLYISFWLVMVGLCWMHLGWEKLKAIGFAFILILTMFPLPNFLYNKISVNLQLISSQLGVAMMQLCGMSAYREGNIIDLGFTQLQVVDACSGLRYLFPLIVLGILLAYFFRAAFWKKAIVVISTIPLSIITNSLRIALTGILYQVWGAKVAEGFFHGFSGWFIFMFSLAILLLEMWILKKVQGSRFKVQGSKRQEAGRLEGLEAESSKLKAQSLFFPPQFIVAVILLGATFAFSQGIEFREKIPIKKSFEYFPVNVGQWSGVQQSMEQKIIDTLDLDDYIIIDYKDSLGRSINFYVAYYESQRKGESIHSPETCLPGSGWIFNQAGAATIPLSANDDGFMKVNRAFMQKNGYKQLSYYWFPQRGRILTNAYQLKIFVFWDALTKQRTDGALVRLITPVYESEELKDAEARLQGFTREIVPVLGEFLPD